MSERRYKEAEVRKILELATRPTATQPAASASSGMTLAEIQSIGVEVGVEPDAIARAAASLDAAAVRPRRRSLGMPIDVAHTVHLPRALTDAEWEQLVAELRATFRARGQVRTHGGLREWSNGNLHACVEPAAGGHRLRMETVKGDAAGFNALGLLGLATGAATAGGLFIAGDAPSAIFVSSMLGAGGAGAILGNLIRLPRWRGERSRQMRHIAQRVTAIVRGADASHDGAPALPPPDPQDRD